MFGSANFTYRKACPKCNATMARMLRVNRLIPHCVVCGYTEEVPDKAIAREILAAA